MEASTAPAIPACQSLPSISATACGRVAREVAGNTARATPAASALASAPPMRVVFFVAVAGKPRSCVASASLLLTPTAGARESVAAALLAAAAGDGGGHEQERDEGCVGRARHGREP